MTSGTPGTAYHTNHSFGMTNWPHLVGPAHERVRALHAFRAVGLAEDVEHDGCADRQAAVAQRPSQDCPQVLLVPGNHV